LLRFAKFGLSALALAGCTPDYSPNTYASNAVQQANKVEPATVVGFRQVEISASGTVGAVSGGAAGGILGAQADGSGLTQALGAVGGGILGSLVGTGIEHATSDTTGWEYIVRKANGELLSVTQREKTPIALGQKVLVITGNQARIVPDYSAPPEQQAAPAASEKDKLAAPTPTPTPPTPAATASPTPLTPPAPASEVAPQAAMPITETKMPPETAPPDATPPETTTPTPAPSPPPAATDAPTTPPW
jgi:outer membrane lipoprotein SlyB